MSLPSRYKVLGTDDLRDFFLKNFDDRLLKLSEVLLFIKSQIDRSLQGSKAPDDLQPVHSF